MGKSVMEQYLAPKSPEYLSESSKVLWKEVLVGMSSVLGRLAIFQQALGCIDRLDQIGEAINGQPVAVKSKSGLENRTRGQFMKLAKGIGLDRVVLKKPRHPL